MERLFVAVALTDPVRRALMAHLERGLPGGVPGRAVPPENWHLTLRFLGDTAPEAAATVLRELRPGALPAPFRIALDGFGAFPRPARASVFWVGVSEGVGGLTALAEAAESAARAAGFAPERRPYTPHLTLSRLRAPEDVRPVLERLSPVDAAMEVEEMVLYRSRLGGGPARYEAVERLPLS